LEKIGSKVRLILNRDDQIGVDLGKNILVKFGHIILRKKCFAKFGLPASQLAVQL
jgi:hypothetical protein